MAVIPDSRRIMKNVIIVFAVCGGLVWLAIWTWSFRGDARLREAEVLVDLRTAQASFKESVRIAKVGLLDIHGAENAAELLTPLLKRSPRIEWQPLDALSVQNGNLQKFDILLVPGGSARHKAEALGDRGRTMIREFVQNGGGYVGICGGAFLATSGHEWRLGLVNSAALTGVIDCEQGGRRPYAARGSGLVSVEFSELTEGVFSESKMQVRMQYSSGPIFCRDLNSGLSAYAVLARFRTEIYECNAQQGTMINTPAIIASKFGKGTVVLFSPHPEMSPKHDQIVIDAIIGCASHRVEKTDGGQVADRGVLSQ